MDRSEHSQRLWHHLRPIVWVWSMAALFSIVVGGLVLSPIPAQAGAKSLQLSHDGVNFSRTLGQPIFDTALRRVPGEQRTTDLWVRNSGQDEGVLRIDATRAISTNADFAAALELSVISVDATGTVHPRTINEIGECAVLLRDVTVMPGQAVRLTVRATVTDLSEKHGQDGSVGFQFRAVLRDASAPAPQNPAVCTLATGGDIVDVPGTDDLGTDPGTGTDPGKDKDRDETGSDKPKDSGSDDGRDPADGSLAVTGAGLLGQLLAWGSGALILGGLLLAAVTRRREARHE